MSPHALSVSDDTSETPSYLENETLPSSLGDDLPAVVGESNLQRSDDDDVQDLVCVGFGPAALAIAVALHDSLELKGTRLSTRTPRVRFLEQQPKFAWHAGMLLPGAKMQITFMKDMATLRNPRSEFTFVNYLHEKGRLVSFTNLGTFLPQRIEYEDYMRWCAEHFANVVDYSQTVQSVKAGEVNQNGAAKHFEVTSLNKTTGESQTLKAKHVVIAAGGKPNIPKAFPYPHSRIIHSSQYATHVHDIFPDGKGPRTVAVIGGGQSAAEVWHNIPSRFPGAQSLLMIRGSSLRPSDDSPFVNEVFNPDRVDDIYAQSPEVRKATIALDKATNYGVVRIELLEEIYNEMYAYQLKYRSETEWPHRILNHREVTGVRDVELDGRPAVELEIKNNSGSYVSAKTNNTEKITVDLVVVASGYIRNSHEEMLHDLRDRMPGGDSKDKPWSVGRDYAVDFEEGAVAPDAGIFLQGCNEKTHGLSDTLLSILAVRGGEMVDRIFGTSAEAQKKSVQSSFEQKR
ncbi:unnamed protein product [Zymoseptoria tritici ST99CH_3D1]|nr:unnamed protein product [Zymoseptoria tritici ST99CH_3D1]